MSEPWPRVRVGGRLESAEMEWLHTNGAGSYAMSTVAMRHTRRYHGLLVAALDPPVDRYVVVSHLETTVTVGERAYRLTPLQAPDAAPLPGYRYLESFDQDPLPRFGYRLGRARLEPTFALVRGSAALVVRYRWNGPASARIRLRPLLPMRRVHLLTREHGGMLQRLRLKPNQVVIQPMATLPTVAFCHSGVFLGSPDWQRKLEYPEDKLRRVESEEDLWSPGSIELALEPGQVSHVLIAVGEVPEGAPVELLDEAERFLRAQDPGDGHPRAVRELFVAAEQFCADRCEHPAVIAGYPWLTALSRDQLIALPGLYLVRGRIDEAKRALGTIVSSIASGLVPRRVRPSSDRGSAPSPEATLWLFDAARHVASAAGTSDPFVRETLYPALRDVFEHASGGGNPRLRLVSDGLVRSDEEEPSFAWMDHTGGPVVTPRRGLTVEFQALWSKGCETLASLAGEYGDTKTSDAARAAMTATRAAFARRFWCQETRYPFDCLRDEEDVAEPLHDSSIRPNALVALDVDPDLFERWQAQSIVDRVRQRLLTPRGIRSLDPDQPGYRAEYGGTFAERQTAYQQGLAWTHLIGAYARAALRLAPGDFDLEESLRASIEESKVGGPVLGQVSQFADGEPPYRPGGCPAQATSVAELLRTLVWNLGL